MTLQEVNTPKLAVGGSLELINRRRTKYTDEEALELVQRGTISETSSKDVAKLALERLWFRCIAWYIGQNTNSAEALFFNNPDLAGLVAEPDLGYRANHIFPLVLRQVARLAQQDGRFEVLPKTPDWRDIRAAKVAEKIWAHYHAELDFKSTRAELAFWAVCTGTGFGLTEWDVDAGDKRRIYDNPFGEDVPLEPQDEQFLDRLGMYRDVAEGELIQEALGPFQVTVPGDFARLDQMPWLVIERVRSIEWMWKHYPSKAAKIRTEDIRLTMSSQYWRRLASIVRNSGFSLGGLSSLSDNESLIVREFWRPPGALVRDGARIVACNGTLLENSPHPKVERGIDIRYPVQMMRYALAPGRFWGVGLVEQLIGPQAEHNEARTQLADHRNNANKIKWMAPRGAELTPTPAIGGEVWEYNAERGRPEAAVPPPLSQAHVLTPEMALNDMRLIAGQSEVSQGQTPPNVRSGVAIRALQERDIETVGYSFESMEAVCQKMATDALKWIEKSVTAPRAAYMYGHDRVGDLFYFLGGDMRGNIRVRVVPRSMAPRSRAAVMENAYTLAELGFLIPTNPEDRRYVLHAVDVGELDDAFSVIDQNIRRAQEENEMFANPRQDMVTGDYLPWPDVKPQDDHQLHITEHTRFELTDRWEHLDPIIQMAERAHRLKHQQELVKVLLAAATQQAAAQPQKEPGKPSPPKRDASQPTT